MVGIECGREEREEGREGRGVEGRGGEGRGGEGRGGEEKSCAGQQH